MTGNYLYQQPDINNTFTRRYEHITSVNFRFEEGRWGARGDVSTAVGYLGQRDVWAFMLMPYFNATGKLQFVGPLHLRRQRRAITACRCRRTKTAWRAAAATSTARATSA